MINKRKHSLMAEKAKLRAKVARKKEVVSSLNSEQEDYKRRIQRIFEEHSEIVDQLLTNKDFFGIQVERKRTDKKTRKMFSPKLENNFYEDSFSEMNSQEENSFELESRKTFSKKKSPEKRGSEDLLNENLYSHKQKPSEDFAKNGSCVNSYDSEIGKMARQSPFYGSRGQDSKSELESLDNIVVECIQSLLKCYKRRVQSLFDFYFFNEYRAEKHSQLLEQIEKVHQKVFNESTNLLSESRREKLQKTLSRTENQILQYKKEFLGNKRALDQLQSAKEELGGMLQREEDLQKVIEEEERMVMGIMGEQKKARLKLDRLRVQFGETCPDFQQVFLENGRFAFKKVPNQEKINLDVRDEKQVESAINDLSVNLETLQIHLTARKPRTVTNDLSMKTLWTEIKVKRVSLENVKASLVQGLRKVQTQMANQNRKISTLDVDNYSEMFLKMADARKEENNRLILEIKQLVEELEREVEGKTFRSLDKIFGELKKRFQDLADSKEEKAKVGEVPKKRPLELKLSPLPNHNIIDMIAQTSREVSKAYDEKYEFSYIPSNEKNDFLEQNVSSSFDPEKIKVFHKMNPKKMEDDFNYSFDQFGDKTMWGSTSLFNMTSSNGFANMKSDFSSEEALKDLNLRLLQFDLDMDIEDVLKICPDFFPQINKLYFFENFEQTNDLVIRNMINGLPVRANIAGGFGSSGHLDSQYLKDYVG